MRSGVSAEHETRGEDEASEAASVENLDGEGSMTGCCCGILSGLAEATAMASRATGSGVGFGAREGGLLREEKGVG